MSNWRKISIGRSAYLRGRIGWQGLRAEEFIEEGPYLVTGTDFIDGKIDWSRCYHVGERRFREASYIQLRNDDLLVTKDGTIGKIAYVSKCPEQAVLNSGIFLLRCSDGSFRHRFLYHVLRSHIFEDFLRQNLAGSTINHLYQYVFERFEFLAPSDAEQERICVVLDLLEQQIERTGALIAKQEQVRAGLMQDLFTRGVDESGRLRLPREEAPHLFRETPSGWAPASWNPARLSDRAPAGGGHLKTGPFGSSLKIEHWVEHGHPVVTIGALGTGRFIETELLHVSDSTATRLTAYQLAPGDIVFSRVADVGRSVVVSDECAGWLMSSNLMRLRVDRNALRPAYLHLQFSFDPGLRAQLRRKINAGGRDVANAGILNSLRFAWPKPDEQDRIVERSENIQKVIDAERALLSKLRLQRTGLIYDLLGKASGLSAGFEERAA